MYPEKFDRTKLTADDNKILADFSTRRNAFDNFIKDNNLKLFTCPGCGFPTLVERGVHDICDVCNWQDDNQDEESADEIWGGPNSRLSLTDNRLNIGKILNQLADSLNGEINISPNEVISILENHDKRMKTMNDKISPTTDISDPLWTEWRHETKKVLIDLIKQK
nr:CPCC family cysteine-rich protein [Pedobacter sp. SYSU D00535]